MDLKPCPFCGSTSVELVKDECWAVKCIACACEGPGGDEKHAMEWNTRAEGCERPSDQANCILDGLEYPEHPDKEGD